LVLGYVAMLEHFHLPAGEPQRLTRSAVMKALELGFTRRRNQPILKSRFGTQEDLRCSIRVQAPLLAKSARNGRPRTLGLRREHGPLLSSGSLEAYNEALTSDHASMH
jgi:hypothetical protein